MGIQRRDISGNAGTATRLQTARQIGGVNFDGTANINLPGVNAAGNQNTSGNAATASSANMINGVPFVNGKAGSGVTNPDSVISNGHTYTQGINLFGRMDGAIYAQSYSNGYVHQIYGDYRTGQIAVRGRHEDGGPATWQPWRVLTNSGQNVGEVGTYAMLRNYGVQGHIEPGTVVAGANLFYASATGTEARSVPAGSNWLCMGHAMGTLLAQSLGDSTTLFLRIS